MRKKYYDDAKENAAFERCVDVVTALILKYGPAIKRKWILPELLPGFFCSLDDLRHGNPVRAEIIIPLAEIPAKKQSFPADLLHPQKVPSASPLQLQNPHIRLLLKW